MKLTATAHINHGSLSPAHYTEWTFSHAHHCLCRRRRTKQISHIQWDPSQESFVGLTITDSFKWPDQYANCTVTGFLMKLE